VGKMQLWKKSGVIVWNEFGGFELSKSMRKTCIDMENEDKGVVDGDMFGFSSEA